MDQDLAQAPVRCSPDAIPISEGGSVWSVAVAARPRRVWGKKSWQNGRRGRRCFGVRFFEATGSPVSVRSNKIPGTLHTGSPDCAPVDGGSALQRCPHGSGPVRSLLRYCFPRSRRTSLGMHIIITDGRQPRTRAPAERG